MTYVTRATYFDHQRALNQRTPPVPHIENNKEVRERVFAELKALGLRPWALWRLDIRYLPNLIHPNEHIKGVTYGKGKDGMMMLVATDLRVIVLSKKPLFVKADDLTYDIVGGVSYGNVGFEGTVTLHSRLGDFKIHTLNLKMAQGFRNYIEERCVENATPRTGDHDPYM